MFGLVKSKTTTNGVFWANFLQINIVQNAGIFYYFHTLASTNFHGRRNLIYGKKF